MVPGCVRGRKHNVESKLTVVPILIHTPQPQLIHHEQGPRNVFIDAMFSRILIDYLITVPLFSTLQTLEEVSKPVSVRKVTKWRRDMVGDLDGRRE